MDIEKARGAKPSRGVIRQRALLLEEMHGKVDVRDVTKRMKALRYVWQRLPDEAYQALCERLCNVHWCVPGAQTPASVTFWELRTAATIMEMVYLAPLLEECSFDFVVDTVAHELAHVYHKHAYGVRESERHLSDMAVCKRHEREAQRTVRMWGFAMKEKRL
jgi:hypothetical protein